MHNRRIIRAALALALAAGLLMSFAVASGSAKTKPARKLSPIIVFSTGSFDAPTSGYHTPEIPGAVKARAAYINAHGGIRGHKVIDISCNDQGNPNQAGICAHQAVADHAVAVVGTQIGPFQEAQEFPVLAAAGIPVIGVSPLTPVAGSSPVAFGITNGAATVYGTVNLLKLEGASKIACLIPSIAEAPSTTAAYTAQMRLVGAQNGGIIYYPSTAVDFTPFVAQAMANGVNGIYVGGTNDSEIVGLLQAIRSQGFRGKIAIQGNNLTPAVLRDLGNKANGIYAVEAMAPIVNSKLPAIKMYRQNMEAFDPSLAINEYSLQAWLSMWDFERVAAKLHRVTAAAVLNAMRHLTNLSQGGITPPLTTSHRGVVVPSQPLTTQVFNATVTYNVVKNGRIVGIPGPVFRNPYKP